MIKYICDDCKKEEAKFICKECKKIICSELECMLEHDCFLNLCCEGEKEIEIWRKKNKIAKESKKWNKKCEQLIDKIANNLYKEINKIKETKK